ncbi:uncharacterized protein LOC142178920 [Nicotiana tabacum]|uniref:Uncharacterized protein LOC142178920 n=1 Tax=Nicotiana tabacum TaxID=4097 RepID=A0AC58U5S9_TOBAC
MAPQRTTDQYDQIMKLLNKDKSKGTMANTYSFIAKVSKGNWIVDTGETNHMVADLWMLTNVKNVNPTRDKRVHLPNGDCTIVSHVGNCKITETGEIHDVTSQIGKWGGIGKEKDVLYILVPRAFPNTDKSIPTVKGLNAQTTKEDIALCHKRLGHASGGSLKEILGCKLEDCKSVIDSCAFNRKVQTIRTDNDGEFVNSAMKPLVSHLKTLGCLCFASVLPRTDKFASRAMRAVFMGYSAVTKGYVLYDLDGDRFFVNKNVVFKESSFPFQETIDDPRNQIQPIITDVFDLEDTNADESTVPIIEEPHIHDTPTDDIAQPSDNFELDLHTTTDGSSSAPPDSMGIPLEATSISLHNHHAGQTHPDSLRRSQRESKEPVWLTDYIKANRDVERFKARLVAKGYNQKEGLDYNETFSPVVKIIIVRTVLSLVAMHNWTVHQLDVYNAFLQGDLNDEVYMQLPQGFTSQGESRLVCKLVKSLYGLKQASRQWNLKLTEALLQDDFKQSSLDHSLFSKKKGEDLVIILIYVDDMLVTGNNLELIEDTKIFLQQAFKINDLGDLKFFLGMEFSRSAKGLLVN